MNNPNGIMICGLNGSGKTTLGKELSRIFNFKFMDVEDYYHPQSDIPYSVARTRDEVIELMLADIEKHRSFIITSVKGDYGEIIPKFYKLAVYISAPHELRMERIKKRVYDRFGERVLEGGDMYEQEQKFFKMVEARPISIVEDWANTLTCPIIRIDGTVDWRINAIRIAEEYQCFVK